MTPKDLLQLYKDSHGPHFGIVRLDYAQTGKGYWVRLGWRDGLPLYQESVYDRECGGKDKALAQATILRDEAFFDFAEQGIFALQKLRRSRPFVTRKNKTGVPGMTLQKVPSRTGGGTLYAWKVHWSEHGRPKGRTFAFSSYGGGLQAFTVAAMCRIDADLRVYGFSEVDPEPQNLKRLCRKAMETYQVR